MTQINPLINLPSAQSILNFNFPHKGPSTHPLSNISIPDLTQLTPSFHNSFNIPKLLPNDNLSKRFSNADLGNPVAKKVKKNPEASSLAIPSFQPKGSNTFQQESSPFDKFSMLTVGEPIQVTFSEDGKLVRVDDDFPQLYSNSSAKDSSSKMKNTKAKGIMLDDKKNVVKGLKIESLSEIPSQRTALKDFNRKELSNKEKDSTKSKPTFNCKIEEDLRELQFLGDTLPSTNMSSPAPTSQANIHIPKLCEPKLQDINNRKSNHLQSALHSLEEQMLSKPHKKAEPLIPRQATLPKNDGLSFDGLLNNLLEIYLAGSLKDQLLNKSPALDMNLLNDLTLLSSLINLQSTNINPDVSFPLLGLSGNELFSANLEQVSHKNLPKINQQDLFTVANNKKEKASEKAKITVTSKSPSDSCLSTTSGSSSKSDEEKERKEPLPVLIQIQKTPETKKITQEKVEVTQGVKQSEAKKVKTLKITTKVVIRREVKTKKNGKESKKKRVLLTRWNMASKRRVNRWQLGRDTNEAKPSGCKRATKGSSKGTYLIDLHGEDFVETSVGPNHQVKKLPIKPQKTPNPRREAPKLKWDPNTLKKARLEAYFKKLGEILEMDVNQEKAINLLQEEENDPKKVYKRIEGKEKEYMREFTVRPKRRPEGRKDFYEIFQ